MAVLAPCLGRLRSDVNRLAPLRDKASDGWIGDGRHCPGSSDHCPDSRGTVHAIDVDKDLRALTMTALVAAVVTACREGRERRLQYVIWNRRIWSRSWGWLARTYTGDSPHDQHAHFSARYGVTYENDTSEWDLGQKEEHMPLTPAEVAAVAKASAEATAAKVLGKPWSVAGRTLTGTMEALLSYILLGKTADEDVKLQLAAILKEASDNPDTPVALTPEAMEVLADILAARMPVPAPVTVDVLEEALRRVFQVLGQKPPPV